MTSKQSVKIHRSLPISLSIICCFTIVNAASFFHCEIETGALYAYEKDGSITTTPQKEAFKFTLVESSGEWSLVGSVGQSSLTVLRQNSELVQLMEQPPLGGTNIYTLYPQKKAVSFSKQYTDWRGDPLLVVGIGKYREETQTYRPLERDR